MSRAGLALAIGGALLLALGLRLPQLDRRPMHQDEAVHAIKFQELWETGRYVYDPSDFHGPTIYYAALPIAWLSGVRSFAETSEWTFRLVTVIFGVGLILLLPLAADGLGRAATAWAALLTAVSPACAYYSRYFIQETPLVFFTFAAIACGWRFLRSGRAAWAVAAGLSVGLVHATKETCVLALGAAATAIVLTGWLRRGGDRDAALLAGLRGGPRRVASAFAVAALTAIVVSAALLSGFGANWPGALDAYRAYGHYLERSDGAGLHNHAWYYYFQLLLYTHRAPGPVWSEALIVALAVVGGAVTLRRRREASVEAAFGLFILIYTVLLTAAYCAIAYKTPWCALGFLHGMILLAGIGASALVTGLRPRQALPWSARGVALPRVVVAAGLLAAAAQLGWQAWRSNTRFAADNRNPYVYAHPVQGAIDLADYVEALSAHHPDGRNMLVMICTSEYWPLPWYLRRMSRVGYFEPPPAAAGAPVVVSCVEPAERQPALRGAVHTSYYGLRPDVVLAVHVDDALWRRFANPATSSAPVVTRPAAEGAP
jgi:uncharacterized protein (TIGR03663 family)